MGRSKGVLMLFLDRFRDRRVGLIPLTLVLSLRSRCLRLEDLTDSIMPL